MQRTTDLGMYQSNWYIFTTTTMPKAQGIPGKNGYKEYKFQSTRISYCTHEIKNTNCTMTTPVDMPGVDVEISQDSYF